MIRPALVLGAMAAAATMIAGSIAEESSVWGASPWASTVPAPAPAPGTVEATRSAALAGAEWLLGQLPLPAGATQSSAEPAGDGGFLARPGVLGPATPNLVDEHTWWVVPGSRGAVLAYIRAHPPAGAMRNLSGSSVTYGPVVNETHFEFVGFTWPRGSHVPSGGSLVATAVQLPDGSTGLRLDAQVVWMTPRPPTERIHAGAQLLRISVHSSIKGNQPKQRSLSVTSTKKIEAIVALLNSLPAAQPGQRRCPEDFGITVRLAFHQRGTATPSAIVAIDPSGCGGVQLTIDGIPQPGLEGGTALIGAIDHVLGIKLKTAPARLHARGRASSESNSVDT